MVPLRKGLIEARLQLIRLAHSPAKALRSDIARRLRDHAAVGDREDRGRMGRFVETMLSGIAQPDSAVRSKRTKLDVKGCWDEGVAVGRILSGMRSRSGR
jgi:hypothetical protein